MKNAIKMNELFRLYAPIVGLGATQIIGYGALMYAYAILLPRMADDLGLSLSTVFGILSLGLFFGGLVSPLAGHLVDRYGGRWVMTGGSILAGLAVVAMAWTKGPVSLFVFILIAEGAGMFVLYNVAFASIARLESSVRPAQAISIITLFGGVASTIFWPLTLALETALGWQVTWMVLGAMVLLVCVPIHFFALAGPQRDPETVAKNAQQDWPQLRGSDRRKGMIWMIISFVCSGYLMGAVMTLWVTNVQDLGHTAALAALAGAIIGPFKTIGRFLEMVVSRNLYPLTTYALSMGLMLAGFGVLLTVGFSVPGIILAAALYGMGDGIKTIARGTLPLALFGQKGYGARLGWISFVQMGVNASSPFIFAWMTQTYGGWFSFATMAGVLSLAVGAYFFIPDPRKRVVLA
ncbi:MFS transporter [Roseibium sp.]|uniref:MFS transporter n=1 Tax=Roseibium sp. TaxID=1936156 RepID=UPI003BA9201C